MGRFELSYILRYIKLTGSHIHLIPSTYKIILSASYSLPQYTGLGYYNLYAFNIIIIVILQDVIYSRPSAIRLSFIRTLVYPKLEMTVLLE